MQARVNAGLADALTCAALQMWPARGPVQAQPAGLRPVARFSFRKRGPRELRDGTGSGGFTRRFDALLTAMEKNPVADGAAGGVTLAGQNFEVECTGASASIRSHPRRRRPAPRGPEVFPPRRESGGLVASEPAVPNFRRRDFRFCNRALTPALDPISLDAGYVAVYMAGCARVLPCHGEVSR